MISRNSDGGFFAAHWEWIVAAVGLVALAGGAVLFAMSGGDEPEECADRAVSSLMSGKRAETGVKPVEMAQYERALMIATAPPTLDEVSVKDANFLAPGVRMLCPFCAKPIPVDTKPAPEEGRKCPECGKVLPEEEKIALDSDGDGLPDEWERKYGLDPKANDAGEDKDGDGFTNAEEFAAKTNPSDKESHPDYFDSFKLMLPLKETFMPFYLEQVQELPGGRRRYYFRELKARGRGVAYMPLEGEEIGAKSDDKDIKPTGFVVKGVRKETVKKTLKAAAGDKPLVKTVEVFIATVERKSDKKSFDLRTDQRRTPLDVQATIAFSRGEPRESVVVPGDTITIYGKKYKIVGIKGVGKGAEVSVEEPSGKIRVLKALE